MAKVAKHFTVEDGDEESVADIGWRVGGPSPKTRLMWINPTTRWLG